MSEPLSIYRLAEELEHRHITTTIVPGRIVLAGYASHNWMFATSVEAARRMQWWGGKIYVVASAEEAMEKMGVPG